jgi:uncharacterized protein
MPAIPPEARDLVVRTRLGFVATTNQDGTPNLSPKGTLTVWDDDTLMFADLDSPGTLRNLARNPAVEVNVVDGFLRKGFRFRGRARVLSSGPEFEGAVARYVAGPEEVRMESGSAIRHVVMVDVEQTRPLVSPAYRDGVTESAMRARWLAHYTKAGGPAPARRRTPAGAIYGVMSFLLFLGYFVYALADPTVYVFPPGSAWGPVVFAVAAVVVLTAIALVVAAKRRRKHADAPRARYSDRWSV